MRVVARRLYSTGKKGNFAIGGDSRNEIIRRALFDAPLRESDLKSNEATTEKEIVIERAFQLYLKEKREIHQTKLSNQYKLMVEASNKLKEVSPELFLKSTRPNIDILFPKQLKVPTETPPTLIWDYQANAKKVEKESK